MDGLIMALILNYYMDKHRLHHLYTDGNLRIEDEWEDIGSSQQLVLDILQQRVHP